MIVKGETEGGESYGDLLEQENYEAGVEIRPWVIREI